MLMVSCVPNRDQALAERQDLGDEVVSLVAVMQHERVDAGVDPDQFEAKVEVALERRHPIAPQSLLAADSSFAGGHHAQCGRRREEHVIRIASQDRLDVSAIPGADPLGCELGWLGSVGSHRGISPSLGRGAGQARSASFYVLCIYQPPTVNSSRGHPTRGRAFRGYRPAASLRGASVTGQCPVS